MTSPNFLGIGVQRGGTTWLHELLSTHPDVYVPSRRKEIHYFTMHNENGIDWYKSFFPSESKSLLYKAIGEISPSYFYGSPRRIISIPSITKLLLILRNPVERAFSHYCLHVRDRNFTGTFEDFISEDPYFALQDGFYSSYLKNFLSFFERDQILILVFEDAMANITKTKKRIAGFLEIDPDSFPVNAGNIRVNASYVPKYGAAYNLLFRVARNLRSQNLDIFVNKAKNLGLKRLFGSAGEIPAMQNETRKRLQYLFASDIQELESILQINLSHWMEEYG